MKGNGFIPFIVHRGYMPEGFYGSPTAGHFVLDAIAGTDSLDVITIGDSNAGFSKNGGGLGGGGWTRGLLRGLNAAGAPTYGSPMVPIMNSITSTGGIQKLLDDDSTEKTLVGYFQNVEGPSGDLKRGSTNGPTGLSNLVVPSSALLPFGGQGFNYAWVQANQSHRSFSQLNGTFPGGAEPNPALPTWNQPGTALRYRVTYARTNTSGGSINPTVYRVTSGSYVSLATASASTYYASGIDLQNVDVPFTMPTTTPASALVFGWAYIGYAYGPAGAVYDSVYKIAKGVAVHNMHYGSNQTSTTISDIIFQANGANGFFLENYLTQIYTRQVAAGGSGRVIVWFNAGINGGGDNGATWTASAAGIITTLRNAWISAGLDGDNLAFVCSVTHPLDTDYGGSTEANMAGARTVANGWASTYSNVTVVDLSQIYTAAQMTASGYYAGAGSTPPNSEAHLSQAGYFAFGQQIVNKLATCR